MTCAGRTSIDVRVTLVASVAPRTTPVDPIARAAALVLTCRSASAEVISGHGAYETEELPPLVAAPVAAASSGGCVPLDAVTPGAVTPGAVKPQKRQFWPLPPALQPRPPR